MRRTAAMAGLHWSHHGIIRMDVVVQGYTVTNNEVSTLPLTAWPICKRGWGEKDAAATNIPKIGILAEDTMLSPRAERSSSELYIAHRFCHRVD